MRAGTLIYAAGGGRGHLARAVAFARRFGAKVIVHSATEAPLVSPPETTLLAKLPEGATLLSARAFVAEHLAGAGRLVVDTFPGGLFGEIDRALLRSAPRTTLLRRYVKPSSYPDYDALAARFDEVLTPYDEGRSEWDEGPARQVHIGPLIRPLSIAPGEPAPLAVLGDKRRLSPALLSRLPEGTHFASGPYGALPPARRYLATAAGYHQCYELDALGVPFGLMPVEKRYDDQHRRADRLSCGVFGGRDLERFLSETA